MGFAATAVSFEPIQYGRVNFLARALADNNVVVAIIGLIAVYPRE